MHVPLFYRVCLKGTTLLFYPCESKEGQSVEATPRHLIIVDGSIMQAIPEHPKRDFIFCLSTAFGDAYLFQVRIRTYIYLLAFFYERPLRSQHSVNNGGRKYWKVEMQGMHVLIFDAGAVQSTVGKFKDFSSS